MLREYRIQTDQQAQLIDITSRMQKNINQAGVETGVCTVFIPHTTAAVTINENADPTVQQDMLAKLADLIPWQDNYQHLEGNSAAHLKASLLGSSEQVIINDGQLDLGTWQGIYLAEFDGPRTRQVKVKLIDD
ncbi:secondary thiamine-phosphate synthase enzyme YjbQ [Halanaerobaculum tunisiense]